MKNQYAGDINDYRKYGLLRILQKQIGGQLLVAWMLTENDRSNDGALRSYLQEPGRWRSKDPELYDDLQNLRSSTQPAVSHIEASGVLPGARFYSDVVPDSREGREQWTRRLLEEARGTKLVFVDPDNGVEVPSKPIGRKGSSKYVVWDEIQSLWDSGCSILIYQHFRREKRDSFAQRMLSELSEVAAGSEAVAFRTPHVLFLLAGQAHHRDAIELVDSRLQETWKREIMLIRPANPTIPDARATHGAEL